MMFARKKPKIPRPRRSIGVLAVIGGLLIASALARIGMQAGAALALETSESALQAEAPPDGSAMQGAGDPAASGQTTESAGAAAGCPVASDIEPILDALKTREERVSKREADLRARMQALSVAEAEIERRMTAMEEAERRLRETLAVAKTAAEDDVAQLTQVYATMKPKQAAALFEEMEPDFAAGFLGRMRPDAAAAIMAGLSPQKACTISVMLAGRNAGAPRE